ncbi:site-2 protease family protein [Roseicyclus mahoneyensis]|jgi:Zn-dependent protease/predicted transcriptional regulator|uniref:Zinc metalloprotease n=1 Tax=Roseicyclus mahoneyensis TaxID=164332 RepID=A0A316GAQ1_9RHOB|nr:site-2 protease family protein [Roseicyclus mahoneyensis]PWK57984.1 Zn-dependent protease [Roseicyclus mahoneyensis]
MFGHSVKLFTLMGFEIKIDASWLLIAALIVWSLSSGYFPQVLPGLSQSAYLILSITAMLALFASLILHELAHSLVARRYGLGIGGITLFLFGGVAELVDEPKSAASEFWIAIAGPIMSFVLAGLFGLAALVAGGAGVVGILLGYLASINLVLAVFNLIPAFPLDGGRVLRAWLWQRSGDMLEATRKASGAGTVLAIGLMGLGLFSALSGGGIGGAWLVLIGFFVLNASRGAYQRLLVQDSLKGRRVAELMTPDPWTAHPDMTLADLADRVMMAHAVSFAPVVGDGAVVGYVDAQLMRTIAREEWANTTVGDVMAAVDDSCLVAPRMTAEDALNRLAQGPHRKLIVVEGRQLRGVLSLRDLMGHIAVVQALGGARTGR